MKLKNILIVVKNIERARQFYHDLFGLEVLLKRDGNVILTEGLVLQDEGIWKSCLNKDIVPESNSCELYFEEGNLDAFVMKLERMYPGASVCNEALLHSRASFTYEPIRAGVVPVRERGCSGKFRQRC